VAISSKPIVWGPFAAGGTITAFVTPVLVLLTLFAALGAVPEALTYDGLRAIVGHWLGKTTIFGVIALSLWSSAHRLRITCYDLGVRSDVLVASVVYIAAAAGMVAALIVLARV
jgi:fumarate reductase subunit D